MAQQTQSGPNGTPMRLYGTFTKSGGESLWELEATTDNWELEASVDLLEKEVSS